MQVGVVSITYYECDRCGTRTRADEYSSSGLPEGWSATIDAGDHLEITCADCRKAILVALEREQHGA